MSSRFYLGASPSPSNSSATSPVSRPELARLSTAISNALLNSDDEDDDDDDDDLPFPQALPRSDFLAPDFEPSTYLSHVAPHRHQTLDDLRRDLRERSQLLSQELLDLVNNHHQDFLNLGVGLRGGEDKVEELRVGLLGFEREVKDVRRKIVDREEEIDRLLTNRQTLRSQLELGQQLLEWDRRLARLEEKLMLDGSLSKADIKNTNSRNNENDNSDDSSEEEDDDDSAEDGHDSSIPLGRLRRRVDDYMILTHLASSIEHGHPFLTAQQHRLARVRNTLLLDLATALKAAAAKKQQPQLMTIMSFYSDMDASPEAVQALRTS